MDYEEITKVYYEEAIKKLQKWISIDSTNDDLSVTVGKPFGDGVSGALKYIATLAREKGFKVDECDGYCTEISYGDGARLIAIFAHADVVPVSGEWEFEPFSGQIKDDIMYGRGTSDDKGPAMAAFYALCALKDNGLIKGYRVTLVIGGNEEKGSRCLEHYYNVLHKQYPDYGFTPDGDFPLIYGEKGIANYETKGDIDLYPVIKIDAGVVSNSVIDVAKAVVMKDLSLEEDLFNSPYKYKVEHDSINSYITIYGKAAHGSTPELGVNAGIQLLDFLGQKYDLDELKTLASLYSETDGASLGEVYSSKLLHKTTYNVGIIKYNNISFSMIVNFRYPENVEPKRVIESIGLKSPFETTFLGASKPLLFDPNSPMIKSLLKVYQDETGDTKTPAMTIGGGTYAKESKNTIAFGSAFPGTDCRIHNNNEFIPLKDFRKSMAIYAHAIVTLGIEL